MKMTERIDESRIKNQEPINEPGHTYPCTPSQLNPTIAPGSQSQVESSQGCNTSSQPAPSIAPGSQVGTSQNSQIVGQPDPFDDPDPDEYVGVNDENIYYHDDDDEAMLLTGHEEHIGSDHILEDEEAFIDDTVDSEGVIVFDPENPKIEVGALFPNREAFKKSLRHFAIKNEFEVGTVKSDKTRFIGKCKCLSCPWRIHASRLQDEKTFMVCMHNLGTYIHGKYKGQLAAAAGVDGHNWLYPVAYGVFDLETTENWVWFMAQLKRAIGTPSGLAISSDAGKGLESAIASVFPDSEHREYMRHLMSNFKKKFHGDIFATHMWPAAKAYTIEKSEYHLREVKEAAPAAIAFLEKNHKHLWCRSKFSELTKCEYVNNNISESFNSWIKEYKSLHVVDLVDQIRQLIMVTFDKRRTIGSKLEGVILPNVIQQLNAKSRNVGKIRISRGGNNCAEVSGMDSEGKPWRHAVELDKRECTCREWQLTGKPCMHAIAFICTLRGASMEDYVHEYFSIAKFRVAYEGVIRPMTDKSQWVSVDPGFKVDPPQMKRPPGRPRKERIPGCLELRTRKQKCKRCKQFGHQERTCKRPPGISEDAPNSRPSTNKRKRRSSNA